MDTLFRTDEIGIGASADLTTIEDAAWDVMEPFVAGRRALWIDAPKAVGVFPRNDLGSEANGAQADFRLQDRIGDRLFTPETVRNRHPFAVVDSLSGLPCWCFGAGGASPNALDGTSNGALRNAPGADAKGQSVANGFATDNDAAFWLPDTGWSVAFRVRMVAPSGTANGVTFGANTGGAVIGGGHSASGGQDSLSVGFENTSQGRLRVFNRLSVGGGQYYEPSNTDWRDALWHDFVVIYDDAAGKYQAWIDGAAQTAQTGITTDINTATGSDKIAIGASGLPAGGPNVRFCGFLAGLIAFQTPVLADAAKRLAIRNLLNSR